MDFRDRKQFSKPVRLQFYRKPPSGDLLLNEFEELAIKRLDILKTVETVGQDFHRNSKKYRESLDSRLGKLNSYLADALLRPSESIIDIDKEIQEDVRSHFILLVAYCRNEGLKRWFIQQEMDLFRYRFLRESTSTHDRFIKENHLHLSTVSPAEVKTLGKAITANVRSKANEPLGGGGQIYYKVRFTEVLDLVHTRRVFLRKGFAYVPEKHVLSLIVSRFRANLSHNLSIMSRAMSTSTRKENARLLPILTQISQSYAQEEFVFDGSESSGTMQHITAGQVESLAMSRSFPPCMQQLHAALKRNSHLRHTGRLQYGLFLKGIGLSLEEALRFWRQAFSKKVDPEKFDKQYAYNVRHNYGKEGKRTSYTPFSCVRIITTSAPGTGDCHGCPFKHSDAKVLRQNLEMKQLSKSKVEQILGRAKEHQYQIACREYFKAVHQLESVDVAINHPNQYFQESLKVGRGELKDPVYQPVEKVPAQRRGDN